MEHIIKQKRGGGVGYVLQIEYVGGGGGIKNYNHNRYRALYPHLDHSFMKSETSPTPVTQFHFIGWG